MTEDERKQRNREAQHRWYLKHREQKMAQVARWKAENPDKVEHYNNVWFFDHRNPDNDQPQDKRKAYKHKWYLEHKPKPKRWLDRDTTIDD